MQYTFGSKGKARFLAAFLLGVVAIGCALFLEQWISIESYLRGQMVDISGPWSFKNGPSKNLDENFLLTVEVPKPLSDSIRNNLSAEFWYQKDFSLPKTLRTTPLSISLGSIKGEHEVYWNNKFLGAGGKAALAVYRIPASYSAVDKVDLRIKVLKSNAMFPGIVQTPPVFIGETRVLDGQLNHYFFSTGVKPLLPAIFKLALFFLFLCFYAAVPYKREYLSFAIFALFACLSSSFYSRFLPGYEDVNFKSGMIFLFFTLSLGSVPFMVADFLRLSESRRSLARVFGFSAALVFILSAFMVKDASHRLSVYRFAYAWLPALMLLPSFTLCLWHRKFLDSALVHRKYQIQVFAIFLLGGVFSWGSGASSFLRFSLFEIQEFLDLVTFAGLSSAIALDFRQTATRSEQAARVVPKWFSGFLAGGLDRVTLELPLITLAVDTVGYTKHLSTLSVEEKEKFHAGIRGAMAHLTGELGAQKISERGDGGIFAWDFPSSNSEREKALRKVLEASIYLSRGSERIPAINFRVGVAAGQVRGEMRAGDISFLGEALNSAARLESLANPGTALIDESLVNLVPPGQLEAEWFEAELKGVVFRARALAKIAA